MSDQLLAQSIAIARERGYACLPPQLNLFACDGLRIAGDLAISAETRPLVRVHISTHYTPTTEELLVARDHARQEDIPLVAFTSDGRRFRTFLTAGNDQSLSYLPYAPSTTFGRSKTAVSIDRLFPFTSILELRRFVSRLADSLYAASGDDRLRLFDSALGLLALKLYDEIVHRDDLQLPRIVTASDVDRLEKLSSQAFAHFGVDSLTPLRSDAGTFDSVRLLLPYSFIQTLELGTQADILGTFYQEIVSSTFRGSLGAYFTPKPVADLAAELCEPHERDSIFDISCGSGTFLLTAANKTRSTSSDVFGSDIQDRMVLAAILNCHFHGFTNPHIVQHDGLRLELNSWRRRDKSVPQAGFSLIVGNPPFAGFDTDTLGAERKDLFARRAAGVRVHKVIPFIDKVAQLLAPGGRAALVVPTSVLNGEAASFRNLRARLAEHLHVTGIVSLPKDAFVHTDCGIEGALLFFKKPGEEDRSAKRQTYF